MKRLPSMKLRRIGASLACALAALVLSAPVQAAPIIYTTETAYLAAISPDFEVNIKLNSAGVPFPAGVISQQSGSDIYSIGNDVNFSSPTAGASSSSVAVYTGTPELGAIESTGDNFGGTLRLDFADPVTAIGFATYALAGFTLELYSEGALLSSTVIPAVAGNDRFFGVQELLGFDALVINTTDTFWSLNGGRQPEGQLASGTRMVGELAGASVVAPEPASMLLLATGLLGAGVRRHRRQKRA